MALRLTHVKKSYAENQVLRGLNLLCPPGGIYGLLGPSGCGKTTLIRILLGLTKEQGGVVEVLGATDFKERKQNLVSTGYMPQELALYNDLSIEQNLLFFGEMQGIPRAVILSRAAELRSFLDLPVGHRPVKFMSGGQRRRVSLAIALLNEPKLLLLDEPTVGVDPELRARIWSRLEELAASGTTILITTHYINEAERSNRVGLMRNGVLLAEDAPEKLIREHECSNLEDVFLKLCMREVVQ